MQNSLSDIAAAAAVIKSIMIQGCDTAVILGSGLGAFADLLENSREIYYEEIPALPRTTVAGHGGVLSCGIIGGRPVLAWQGRFHYYEGNSMQTVTLPVYIMRELGIKNLLLTNAAGGIKPSLYPGALMLVNDHLNFMGGNPLFGMKEDNRQFLDLTEVYDLSLRNLAKSTAANLGIALDEGIYAAVQGPVYETPAEVNAYEILGAAAVGMSTVPEAIAARQCGMRVMGMSFISNMAAGRGNGVLSHEDVLSSFQGARENFINLLTGIVRGL